MSEDQKPEPIKDENGVPWCDTGCRHYNDVPYHQIEGDRSSWIVQSRRSRDGG